jgi:hypothetical protein
MEAAFTDGSGYSVLIRVRTLTPDVVPGMETPSLERPNCHPDCVHSSAAFGVLASIFRDLDVVV